MILSPTQPTLIDPKLIDLALGEIQTELTTGLSWLTTAYGKAVSRKYIKDNNTFVRPEVYVGGKEYLSMFPDSHLGNFSFFSVDDGEEINSHSFGNLRFSANVGLIFWFDYRDVYPGDWQAKTIDNIKFDIITAIKGFRLVRSKIILSRSWELSKNIYNGYSDKEIDNQFLMRPFGGIRIDFEIRYNEIANC